MAYGIFFLKRDLVDLPGASALAYVKLSELALLCSALGSALLLALLLRLGSSSGVSLNSSDIAVASTAWPCSWLEFLASSPSRHAPI